MSRKTAHKADKIEDIYGKGTAYGRGQGSKYVAKLCPLTSQSCRAGDGRHHACTIGRCDNRGD
jgi:hypothetical protein